MYVCQMSKQPPVINAATGWQRISNSKEFISVASISNMLLLIPVSTIIPGMQLVTSNVTRFEEETKRVTIGHTQELRICQEKGVAIDSLCTGRFLSLVFGL